MTLLYSVNGLALHNPAQGRKLLDTTQWASPVQMRNTNIVLPNMHGSVPVWQAPLEPTTITMRVRIQGETPAELNERWNELIRHMGVGINQPVVITRTRSAPDLGDGQQVTVAAQLVNIEVPDFHCNPGFCDRRVFHASHSTKARFRQVSRQYRPCPILEAAGHAHRSDRQAPASARRPRKGSRFLAASQS
jgi:hypothetical protein